MMMYISRKLPKPKPMQQERLKRYKATDGLNVFRTPSLYLIYAFVVFLLVFKVTKITNIICLSTNCY